MARILQVTTVPRRIMEEMCARKQTARTPRSHINLNVPSLHRLEVQADVQKEIFPKDTASLGAISDNASTRAMAGSIISSYNPQDRYVNSQSPGQALFIGC